MVYAVLQRGLQKESSDVLCAFTRNGAPGSVYIEAWVVDAVHEIVRGRCDIIYNGETPHMELVPLEEWIGLLEMVSPGEANMMAKMSWVRIRRSGRFRGRLGLVTSTDKETCAVVALVASQAQTHRKRK